MDVLNQKDLEMQLAHQNQETKVKTTWLINNVKYGYNSKIYGLAIGFLLGWILAMLFSLAFGWGNYQSGYISGIRNCTMGRI